MLVDVVVYKCVKERCGETIENIKKRVLLYYSRSIKIRYRWMITERIRSSGKIL